MSAQITAKSQKRRRQAEKPRFPVVSSPFSLTLSPIKPTARQAREERGREETTEEESATVQGYEITAIFGLHLNIFLHLSKQLIFSKVTITLMFGCM